MQSKTALALLAAVACPLVLGCSSSGTAGGTPVATTSAALRRTQSCEDLTLTLREDARSKLNRRIDAEVRAIREGYAPTTTMVRARQTQATWRSPPGR